MVGGVFGAWPKCTVSINKWPCKLLLESESNPKSDLEIAIDYAEGTRSSRWQTGYRIEVYTVAQKFIDIYI